jgi:SAM-dependent methyltransferase
VTWIPDEIDYAGLEHLDADYVAGYDAKAQVDPSDDLEILIGHGLRPGTTIVDLGAGTGVFAAAAAATGASVIAVDVSPPMAAHLRDRFRDTDNVRVVEAGFLTYEHEGLPADFVHCRNALHQLPDFWKGIALARIASVMRTEGIFRVRDLVFDFDPSEADEFIPAWMAGGVDDPRCGWTPAELAEHVRLEFSTYRWLFEPMLDRAGFEILDVAYVRRAYGAYTARLTRRLDRLLDRPPDPGRRYAPMV